MPPTSRARTAALLAAALAFLAACSARSENVEPPTVASLAKVVGCKPELVTDARELTEGACRTGEGAFRLLTFSAKEGEENWLTEAKAYGGTYLVGERWVVIASQPTALPELRSSLGGRIEGGAEHQGAAPGHAGGSHH
ncbi:hypothetical protein [Streptomyces sp. NPDC006879]|uniref:hypothetical protein n=1 Tax=Streptomyces sp. NPDC006879 TaxID=3364767 RepID=UPI0036982856